MLIKLDCRVQNYAWGKIGGSSTVAQLVDSNDGSSINPKLPYAEY